MLASTLVSPDYDKIQRLLTVESSLLVWHLSDERLTTFIVQPGDTEPHCLIQDTKKFHDWLQDWDCHYHDYRPKQKKTSADSDRKQHPWRVGMVQRLTQLAQLLYIPDLCRDYLHQTQHLILVPHRDLHRLPLHALFTDAVVENPPPLRHGSRYLPSIQTGLTLQAAPTPRPPQDHRLLSIENPQNDLRFAHVESVAINALFRHVTPLDAQTATLAQTRDQLQKKHDLFHFTGHGAYHSRDPEKSALRLAQEDELTAAAIRDLDLSHYRLVYLAACETALTGQSTIDDEYVGLVSAFLQARARAVISTLWTVEEISSAWIAIRFYQLWLHEKHSLATALSGAQTWLRIVTKAELIAWLETLTQKVTNSNVRSLLNDEINELRESNTIEVDPPYQHPYYWAAFTLTGGL